MDIAPLIARVARGKHGSQHLTQDEAKAVFLQLMHPDADQLQLGAFLIAQRMKGESSAELAGFVEAVRASMNGYGEAAAPRNSVDLPCYAGKRRGAHAYLTAALKMRDAGVPILVHGIEHIDGRVTAWQVLQSAGVTRANSLAEAAALLRSEGMAYVDLAEFSPDLFRIYNLRPRLGVRSYANSVARLLNPLRCDGQLNGFFHTPYGELMAGTNVLLGQKRSLIFMGAEGEPELYADRQKLIVMQQGEDTFRVNYAEAGEQAYPREPMALSLLKRQSLAMVAGEIDGREAAVVRRMCEAFEWAAGDSLATGWSEEV